MELNAKFKYTVPISKAEVDADEELYVYGEAAGPEVDKQGERMAPEAIAAFAQQIKDRAASGSPVPYVDEHDKSTSGRGVLRHLGDVVDGGITANDHLWVKVRLNKKNPAATFLFDQIVDEGKQFGMSIQGQVLEFVDEVAKAVGKRVRTFKSVVLDHIANTTKPVWTPSLGTVLNRAVEKALADESNGEEMEEETVVESTSTEETTTETPVTEAVNQSTTEQAPEATVESKLDALISAVGTLADILKPATPAPVVVERAESETPEPVTNVTVEQFDALAAELAALKERSASQKPPVVQKAEAEEFRGLISDLDPEIRLRLALAAQHGEDFS